MIAPPPDLGLSFAPATVASVEVLAALHAACFDASWSASSMVRMLVMPGVGGAIAMISGAGSTSAGSLEVGANAAGELPAGFVLWRRAADECEILTICVLRNWRGQGIAAALLENAMEVLAQKGVHSVFLEVSESNTHAAALYERNGFVAVGSRAGYYQTANGKREAALVMRRDLEAGR